MPHTNEIGIDGMVSVVIPTYRRPDRVRIAVESALAQDLEKLEVIVVDDNRDETLRAATVAALRGIHDRRLIYISNHRRSGGCGARNSGIDRAQGEFVAFLDDDDEYLANGLHLQRDVLLQNPGAVLAYGHADVVDEVYGYSWTYSPRTGVYGAAEIWRGNCPMTSSVVIARRCALNEAGMFDEEMLSFQDLDMWLRVATIGDIVAHGGKVARFVQHDGLRTSINIELRRAGLEHVLKKWSSSVEGYRPIEEFRDRFLSAMHLQNGKLLLAAGLSCRRAAVGHMWDALVLARTGRTRIFAHLVLALFGFRISRAFAKGAARWRLAHPRPVAQR